MRRTAVLAVAALVALGAAGCGGDDAGTSLEDVEDFEGEAGDLDFSGEFGVLDTGADGDAAWVAAFDEGVLLLTDEGDVARSDDGGSWEEVDADGLPDGDDEVITGLALAGDTVVAVGGDGDDEFDPGEARVWHSEDGVEWDEGDTDGLEDGDASVDGVTSHDDRFIAFGSDEDGNERLWESDDGDDWEEIDADGFDDPDAFDSQSTFDLAISDDSALAVQLTECLDCDDDIALTLLTADDVDDDWDETEFEGLDDFKLPNTDLPATAAAVDGGFLVFGGSPTGDDEFGDREPAVYFSEEGEDWDDEELAGPETETEFGEFFPLPDVTAVDGGAVAVQVDGGDILVWRLEFD